ncbi:hypothetical protein RIF29_25487 [Crotalaria pallida]|uniref:Pectinesterase inhibitor domain-containing protein n=1 Tax=Crotalaria pallida TaxID=3830 RepID=A0AAN9EM96_CROPI
MKLKSCSTLVPFYLAFLSTSFIPPTQSTLSHTSLLDQICRQSPHYHSCIMTLQSSIHHRSKDDIAGFAHLALEIVNAHASVTFECVTKLYVQNKNLQVNQTFESCVALYNMIVKIHLPEAVVAMEKGDYNVAKQKAYVAAIQASSCENTFSNSNSSSLRDSNRYVYNLCAIIVSIINKLLLPNQPYSS